MHSRILLTSIIGLLLSTQPILGNPVPDVDVFQSLDGRQVGAPGGGPGTSVTIASADVKAEWSEAACPVDPMAAAATATESSIAKPTTSSAKMPNAAAAPISLSSMEKARYHVQSIDESYQVYGVDAIWHNQYRGPDSDFIGMRKQFDCDINQLLLQVAKHIEIGLYSVITMSASPHSLTVVCGCERMQKDMPGDMWNDPAFF